MVVDFRNLFITTTSSQHYQLIPQNLTIYHIKRQPAKGCQRYIITQCLAYSYMEISLAF